MIKSETKFQSSVSELYTGLRNLRKEMVMPINFPIVMDKTYSLVPQSCLFHHNQHPTLLLLNIPLLQSIHLVKKCPHNDSSIQHQSLHL